MFRISRKIRLKCVSKIVLLIFLFIASYLCYLALLLVTNNMETIFNQRNPITEQKMGGINTKKILLFTKFFLGNWYLGHGFEPFQKAKCKFQNCFLTENNFEASEFAKFDAVVFHLVDLQYMWMSPKYFQGLRKPHQRFISFNLESPIRTRFYRFDEFGTDFFNWTMSYRSDSDIFSPYGRIEAKSSPEVKFDRYSFSVDSLSAEIRNLSNKQHLVAWLVSNCNSRSGREQYVRELQKHIKVDVFGKCGVHNCDPNCMENIKHKYKFYLSFENSVCKDYVTEKFYGILQQDILPIVLGEGNYSAIAPEHSYIDVRDFQSPESLGNYLKQLDKDEEEYLSYFWWKNHYQVTDTFWYNMSLCNLCEKLHTDHSFKSIINLQSWLFFTDSNNNHNNNNNNNTNNNKAVCKEEADLPWLSSNSKFSGESISTVLHFLLDYLKQLLSL